MAEPTTLLYSCDTFTGPQATGSSGSTTGIADSPSVGTAGAWTDVIGGIAETTAGGDIRLSASGGGVGTSQWQTEHILRPSGESYLDQQIVVEVPASAFAGETAIGLLLRWNTGPTYYMAQWAASGVGQVRMRLYRISGTTPTQLTSLSALDTAYNSSHAYRVTFTAEGASPTNLDFVIHDIDTATDVGTLSTTDSTSGYQVAGTYGLTTFRAPSTGTTPNRTTIESVSLYNSEATGSITITTPVRYTVRQQTGGTAGIAISGTYTGSPTAIEASWNGGAYATIDAAPAAGSFSGTLASQPTGQGTLTVRFTNDTDTSDTVADIGVGDVFVCYGQSNMSGRGTNNQTFTATGGINATLFGNDYEWKVLTDPYDSATGQDDSVSSDVDPNAAAGSFIPGFATLFVANRGYPCAFIPAAKGGANITSLDPDTDHLDRATLYGSMNYRAQNCGSGGVKAVLYWQGEANASAATSQASYNSLLDGLADAVAADLGVPLVVARLQDSTGITDANENAIRAAVDEAVADNVNVVAGPDLEDIQSDDSFHLQTDEKLADAAARWWAAVNAAFYLPVQIPGEGGSVFAPGVLGGGFAGGLTNSLLGGVTF